MDITIEGIIFHDSDNIEIIPIAITQSKYFIIRSKLKFERRKITEYFKDLKAQGIIKSNFRPKNKKIQDKLDNLCKINRRVKETIEKIDQIYKWKHLNTIIYIIN